MFSEGKAVNATLFHDQVGFEVDGMIPRLVLGEAMGGGF